MGARRRRCPFRCHNQLQSAPPAEGFQSISWPHLLNHSLVGKMGVVRRQYFDYVGDDGVRRDIGRESGSSEGEVRRTDEPRFLAQVQVSEALRPAWQLGTRKIELCRNTAMIRTVE